MQQNTPTKVTKDAPKTEIHQCQKLVMEDKIMVS